MALTCVRCGLQNPDGNAYCQNCGTPLNAPAGETTGAFAGPPPGPPPSFASPYYAPTGASVPVHRTPWTLIIAAIVALVVVAGGLGTAFAMLGNHGSPAASNSYSDVIPSPTPGVTPSPVASPTATQAATGLQQNDGFSLTLPSGWTVDTRDNETMIVSDPNAEGSVNVASGVSIPTQTAQQNKDTVDSVLKTKYPDTQTCPGTKTTNGSLNGAAGIFWNVCFTITQGANKVAAAAYVFAGANPSGTVYYLLMVITSQANLQSYVNTAGPVVHSIHWKLS